MPRIILDSATKTHLFYHLQIVHRPLVQTLCLDDLALIDKLFFPPRQLGFDRMDRLFDGGFRHHIVRFWIDRHAAFMLFQHLAEQRIYR